MTKSLLLTEQDKASNILLHYFEPLLKGITDPFDFAKIKHVLTVPMAVWNAMVFEDAGHKGTCRMLFEPFDNMPAEEQAKNDSLIYYWIKRKVEMYPHEIWLIRDIKFRNVKKTGEFNFCAIVTLPTEFEHLAPKNWIRIIKNDQADGVTN